jgi:uncharacterized protein YggU (UPF0235/DUF167 family)
LRNIRGTKLHKKRRLRYLKRYIKKLSLNNKAPYRSYKRLKAIFYKLLKKRLKRQQFLKLYLLNGPSLVQGTALSYVKKITPCKFNIFKSKVNLKSFKASRLKKIRLLNCAIKDLYDISTSHKKIKINYRLDSYAFVKIAQDKQGFYFL